ncbi:MAG: NAD(P)/FAD-dependent oxidoreductase [Synechococcaceae bacterium WB8_1A_041]|nr:NAD(P)/FAD-dependent oxidoreductase [Synechococcaceae bacterium WB8_1A_041]
MLAPIVIVGGGFGGLYTALELAKRPNHPPLLLIEPNDRFIFLPFLYELLSGELALWQLAPRYDNLLAGHGIGWLKDRVSQINPETSKLCTAGGKEISYSRVVIATGATPFGFGVPGVQAHSQGFHTLSDVERLQALIKQLKNHPQPLQKIAVVGAGPCGVELACKLADLLQGAAVVELLEKGPQCLPNAKAFNRNQALQALQRRDVRLRCHCQVLMVAANELQLQQEGADLPEKLTTAAVIWTAGQISQPPDGLLAKQTNGKLICLANLQVQGNPEIFSLGDGAFVPHDPPLPATAQVAFQQAPVVARNVMHSLAAEPLEDFAWSDLGEMLSLGVGEASITGMGITLAGPLAQQMRRWAYLTRLPGEQLPLKVAAGWLGELAGFS